MDSSFSSPSSVFNKAVFSSRTRQSSVSSALSGRKSVIDGGRIKRGLGSARLSFASRGAGSSTQPASQSQLPFTTKYDNLDLVPFGLPLPVLVNEAMTFGDRQANVTVSCADNGWAWAVSGRRLLVWQHSFQTGSTGSGDADHAGTPTMSGRLQQRRAPPAGQCRELTLPHCDIGHKAALVCVFVGGNEFGGGAGAAGQQMASCLAVSPAGDVRYWPSIAHDGSSIDAGGIMDGQEFDAIVALPGVGYMLATTTCNLVLLQLQLNNGRHTIVHRAVRPPTGFLGGIGKRFASIIIGMNSNQEREHKFIKLCAVPARSSAVGNWQLSVLADRWIQRWALSPNGVETYLFEDYDMFKQIRDAFHQKLWSHCDISGMDVRLLDMHATGERTVLVLATAINASFTPQFHYALCTFVEQVAGSSGGGAANNSAYTLKNFCQLRYSTFVSSAHANAATTTSPTSATSPTPAATSPATTADPKGPVMRMLVDAATGLVYIFDEKCVLQVTLSGNGELCGSGEPSDKMEFNNSAERVMTGTLIERQAVFFLRQLGFAIVASEGGPQFDEALSEFLDRGTAADADASANGNYLSQSMAGAADYDNLTMLELNPDDVLDHTDAISQLKAAFIYHLKKNAQKCAEVLADLLDADTETNIDAIVVRIAYDLVDDVPAADPRWEEQISRQPAAAALGSSMSMQISQQLKEKKLVLQYFIEFLHATALWPRLAAHDESIGAASGSNAAVQRPTGLILSDISEKVVAAIALKKIHTSHARLIDDAIQTVLRQRNENSSSSSITLNSTLTAQDLFYVKVTRVHEIVKVLATMASDGAATGTSTSSGMILPPVASNGNDLPTGNRLTAHQFADINAIVLAVLADVFKARGQHYALFAIPVPVIKRHEYVPWTGQSGRIGLRDALQQLATGTLRNGARATGEPELRQRLYKQLVEMIDYVLDGRKSYLDSVQETDKYSVLLQQYEAQRADLIQPLVQDRQYELATKLAEKYLDFQTLVQICDATQNQPRLDEYIRKYQHLNFSQFAINWHLRQNKRGDLFERFKHNQADLSRFLADHPSLAWVQAVFNGDMSNAGRVLIELADAEAELLARKKTILSLAKLVSLAAEEDLRAQVTAIDAELRLVGFQEAIRADVLETYGYEANEPKVLKPVEIINLLICEENETATEADFRKALELLAYMDESDEVRRKIWCAAILRDDWKTVNVDAPQEDLQNLVFFKLVDLCFFMDTDLREFLPPLEHFLEASELGELTQSKSFQYLFKLGYEYIGEAYAQRL